MMCTTVKYMKKTINSFLNAKTIRLLSEFYRQKTVLDLHTPVIISFNFYTLTNETKLRLILRNPNNNSMFYFSF